MNYESHFIIMYALP